MNPVRLPDGVTRRQLLTLGSLGAVGLGLPDLLRANAATPRGRPESPKSCIFVVQYGGCSQIDSFDLKPDAPVEIRGPFRPIPTSVPGTRVCEHLPRLARRAHQYAIVRSMTHGNPGHDGGMHVCMTGHSQPAENTPYVGSVVAKLCPPGGNVPPYVWVQNLAGDVQPRYLSGGFLGAAYSPLRVGTDLDNPAAPGFRVKAFDPPADVPSHRLRDRHRLLGQVESAGRTPAGQGATNLTRYRERAVDLLAGPETRAAFDLDRESPKLRDRYGRHPLGQNLLMARRLIEAGTRLVTVTAWTGNPPGEKFVNVQTWDMHGPGAAPYIGSIFGTGSYGLGWALPRVDEALSALLDDLADRGLLESTLVVMVGEFGRAPKISNLGRDHWPACYSALLAGAGVRGGAVYGASDKTAAYVKDSPVRPEDFGATLFHALGVPAETRLGADGFTLPVSAGKPVLDLFG
ncbi:DUF1501 domain-containing protein [Fimbriiglobus ruber]|uniref:DUF1501 domain-containing protein n=1 Tax=Fimbriiglobus ruber TaxID=1908690 RepID=A0A225DCJ7_9BACT|nr:DUF1501 domain-containing protein [Fimbriiglobus ruber]OWK38713.1 hypothetical protein FRUB_07833 [Fimbriiglobus ruber]